MNKYSKSKYLFISKFPLHAPNPLYYHKIPENHVWNPLSRLSLSNTTKKRAYYTLIPCLN